MNTTEKIYFSLRETEKETGVPASTLRYWEKEFEALSPRKDGHGNRYNQFLAFSCLFFPATRTLQAVEQHNQNSRQFCGHPFCSF